MSPAVIPLLSCAVSAFASWKYGLVLNATDPAVLAGVGGTIASVAATMLGFLLASLAVLASINHVHLVRMMRQTGHYQDLLNTILFGCIGFFACMVIGFVLVFGVLPNPCFRVAITAIHVAAIASLIDVGRKLWLVLANLRDS